jgi:hypothetical protein
LGACRTDSWMCSHSTRQQQLCPTRSMAMAHVR